jgi:hypothetical protein
MQVLLVTQETPETTVLLVMVEQAVTLALLEMQGTPVGSVTQETPETTVQRALAARAGMPVLLGTQEIPVG